MAVAVIGGLISSTLLSLVFVPAVFVALDDFAQFVWRLFGRFIGPVDEPGQEGGASAQPSAQMSAKHDVTDHKAVRRPLAAE